MVEPCDFIARQGFNLLDFFTDCWNITRVASRIRIHTAILHGPRCERLRIVQRLFQVAEFPLFDDRQFGLGQRRFT